MASKGKGKLKKKQFRVEGKIIDLKRFAYDVFAYSAAKFGVPSGCICKWEDGENDYGLPNFIVVLSRFIFRCQVKERNMWYTEFKPHYESTKFKSFKSIIPALQRVLYDTANFGQGLIQYEVIITLALISEFILFLYAENCLLYIQELVNYWFEYWCSRKKDLEKAGGLVDLYQKFNNPEEAKVDIFFNKFIPVYCIPYDGSRSLQDVFDQEFNKFFHLSAKNIADMEKAVLEEAARKDGIIRQLASQLSSACAAQRHRVKTSKVDRPRNTGLGIQTHEDLLRNVLEADSEKSPKNVQSKSSQKMARDRRGTAGKKERHRKLSSQHLTNADSEPLKTDVLGTETAILSLDEDSESEIPINTGLGIQTHDDLLRNILGTDTTPPQDLNSKSCQKTPKHRRGSSIRKKTSSSVGTPEQMHTNVLRAESATLPLAEESGIETLVNTGLGIQSHGDLLRDVFGDSNLSPQEQSSTSQQKTPKGRKGSAIIKERQKKQFSPRSTLASPESLKTSPSGTGSATSPLTLSSADRQKRFIDNIGPLKQKEIQKIDIKSSSNEEDIDLKFKCLGRRLAASLDEDVVVEIPRNIGHDIRRHSDLLRDLLRTDTVSSTKEHFRTTLQKSSKDLGGMSREEESQEKTISSRPISDDLKPYLEYLELPLPAKTTKDRGSSSRQKEKEEIETSSRPISDDLTPYFQYLGLPLPAKTAKDLGKLSRQDKAQKIKTSSHPVTDDLENPGLTLAAKLDEDLGDEIPTNTGLGIQTHEGLLPDVFGDNVSSPKDISGAIRRKTVPVCRESRAKKERLKKETSPRSTTEGPERPKISPLEVGVSTSSKLFASASCQRTDRAMLESFSEKGIQKKTSSLHSSVDSIEPFETSPFGSSFATSPQHLSCTGHLGTKKDQTRPSQMEIKKLKSSPSSSKDHQRSRTSPMVVGSVTTHQCLSSASRQRTERDIPESSSQKRMQKKTSSSHTTVEGLESLKTSPLGAGITTSPQDISSECRQEIERHRRGSYNQKDRRKKTSSSHSSLEGPDPLKTSPLGAGSASSTQYFSSACRQAQERNIPGSSIQKDMQKVKSSPHSSVEGPEPLKTSSLVSGLTTSTQNLSSACRQLIERGKTGSTIRKDIPKVKSIPYSSVEGPEPLKTSPLGSGLSISTQNLSSACRQVPERDQTGSSSQKDLQKVKSSPSSTKEDIERSRTSPMGAEAATCPQNIEDKEIETLKDADFWNMTPQQMIQILFGDKVTKFDS